VGAVGRLLGHFRLVGPIRNMRLSTDGVCIKLLTLLKSRVLHAKSLCPFGFLASTGVARFVMTVLIYANKMAPASGPFPFFRVVSRNGAPCA
jgi:hypothetical protein